MAGVLTYSGSLSRKFQVRLWNSSGWSGFISFLRVITYMRDYSKEHIFDPLEMKTSFYLTQDLRQNLVKLAFRNEDGHLSPFVNQIKIIEQDGRKGEAITSFQLPYNLISPLSARSSRRCRPLLVYEGLPQTPSTPHEDQWYAQS